MVDRKTASFVQSLCMGEIEEDILLPFPRMDAAQKETLGAVLQSVGSLLSSHEKDFREWDHRGELPASFLDELREFGLFGLAIPEEHGGLGMGNAAYSRTFQEIGKHDASTAVTVGAHSSIGMRGLLLFGTDEQKRRFLPRLATGEMVAAFCLTEPGSGSDAASIKTKAVRDGDHWVLNGEKIWITNGGMAQFFTVFAKTPGDHGKASMTAFIVTRDLAGISTGPHEDKLGIRASMTTSVSFDDVRVPHANVLGEVGNGFKIAMKILNSGRTGLGGGSVGGMKKLIALAAAQANERHQFGRPIASFGLVKQKVGQMVIDCYVAEAVVAMVAGLVDQGYEDYAVEAAISKVLASESLWRTADEALQIAGGNGYMREFPYERVLRDARINRIFEGTNDILRLFIAFTAMKDVGTQLKELASSIQIILDDPIKGFGVLSGYARKHASLLTGVNRRRRFTKLHPAVREQGVVFEEATGALAQAADRILRKHGKAIVEKQFASRRLAEIMIDLYALGCVLSRVDASVREKGTDGAARELEILKAFSHQASRRMRRNLGDIDDNEDELVKALADDAFERGSFRWDTI